MREARTEEEVEAALRLRHDVFCGEQGVAVSAEQDGLDDRALHVVALDDAGELVGTCRVLVERGVGRLGRMAVRTELRGRGVGVEILTEAEVTAGASGARRMRLHAQLSARGLYERAGYRAEGEVFLEEGIEHVTMEKSLA